MPRTTRLFALLVALLALVPALASAAALDAAARAAGVQPSAGADMPSFAARERDADPPGATVAPAPSPNLAYAENTKSDVFGAQLFTGAFAHEGATQFNPDYAIAIGDRLRVRFWGGFEFDGDLIVDPKGNIFLPHVGPVRVVGVRNQDLQHAVESASRAVFKANVYSYTSLAAAQPVRVFVGGFVNRPGLYNGTSMDSLLHYLDQAGGIDPDRGSFLDVQVKRGEETRAHLNLYEFLLDGRMPLVQLADADVIFVPPRGYTVRASGLVENDKLFEVAAPVFTVASVAALAKPRAEVTHVRVVRNSGTIKNVEYYPLEQAADVILGNGDELDFTADKRPGTITVRVEGEIFGDQEYVLPYGARLGELVGQIEFTPRSDTASLQLFRKSVQVRQKAMLKTSLESLEAAALTARSGTNDEAQLRRDEADLILKWIDRAAKLEPTGQVLIVDSPTRDELLLENGDVLRVPAHDGLVLVSGEVLFPNAVAFDPAASFETYIQRSGGYTQNADSARIVIAHRDGSFDDVGDKSSRGKDGTIRAGDEILVLPRIDVKSRQIAKDLSQILYQIAVSAKVVFGW